MRIKYRRLRLKQGVKREYFTVLLPVLVAVLLVLLSLWSALSPSSPAATVPVGAENVGAENVGAEKWAKKYLDHLLVSAFLIAVLPYSVDSFLERRRRRKYEEEFSEFLFEVSELLRSGIDPLKTLVEISKSAESAESAESGGGEAAAKRGVLKLPKAELKALAPLIKNAAGSLTVGRSFESVMKRVAKETKSKLIERYAFLVVTATYIGGEVSHLIFTTSRDMKTHLKIQREKESELRQYSIIFYIAHAILVAMLFLISDQLLPLISGLGIGGSTCLTGPVVLGGGLEGLELERYFYHLAMIDALIVGLVIGKILHGSVKYGLLHSSVLMIASWVACVLLILPSGF